MDIGEVALYCFFPAAEAAGGVYQPLFQYRIETLTPGVVTRLAGSGEALSQAQFPETLPYCCTGILIVLVRVEDDALGKTLLLTAERIVLSTRSFFMLDSLFAPRITSEQRSLTVQA